MDCQNLISIPRYKFKNYKFLNDKVFDILLPYTGVTDITYRVDIFGGL